ncbi:MAG: hypothetical protein MJK12_20810 [Colwellia sp.]|nr:hypothetical protein [Colwellia sp.]
MINIYSFTKLLHKLILSALLVALAIIPLIVDIDLITAFVFIPSMVIVTLAVSLMIENQLEKMTVELSDKIEIKHNIDKPSRCIIRKGLHCLQKY